MQRVAVLGSTGSIGTNSLEVISSFPNRLTLYGVVAHRSWEKLAEQTRRFAPEMAVLTDIQLEKVVRKAEFSASTSLDFGTDAVARLASSSDVDIVVSSIVGAAGLLGTWAAVEAGKTVALANKETLVVAGPLVMDLAERKQATLIPVDSEHSAIFQALRSGGPKEVKQVILTASGGPFRNLPASDFASITPAMALNHPKWKMGPKITIDSATLMNKALEVIEARWLFGLTVDQIRVVVHPQSIVHSMVEFVDGSVIAQLSPPDMKLPIQLALTYPDRMSGVAERLDWTRSLELEFHPPDLEKFPALELGFEVARRGGTCGAVLNAANEQAVADFLATKLPFCDIPRACRAVLDSHTFDPNPTLDGLLRLDAWARQEVTKWVSCNR